MLAWLHLKLRVDVLCHNALYINYKPVFMNSTAVDIKLPHRAFYGTTRVFVATMVESYGVTLPFNQPKLLNDVSDKMTAMPPQVVAFSSNFEGDEYSPIRHRSTKGRNVWVPTSLYWNSRTTINLPYLPFFSNCRGYGNFIPFWSLIE